MNELKLHPNENNPEDKVIKKKLKENESCYLWLNVLGAILY